MKLILCYSEDLQKEILNLQKSHSDTWFKPLRSEETSRVIFEKTIS